MCAPHVCCIPLYLAGPFPTFCLGCLFMSLRSPPPGAESPESSQEQEPNRDGWGCCRNDLCIKDTQEEKKFSESKYKSTPSPKEGMLYATASQQPNGGSRVPYKSRQPSYSYASIHTYIYTQMYACIHTLSLHTPQCTR